MGHLTASLRGFAALWSRKPEGQYVSSDYLRPLLGPVLNGDPDHIR